MWRGSDVRDIAIVSGYFIRCPLGGYAWQVLHYLWGLRAVGFDAFFYEDTAHYSECFDPNTGSMTGDPLVGVALARSFFAAHGFADRWIFWDALRGRHHGLSAGDTEAVLVQARLAVSLAAVNRLPRWTGGMRVFVDLDPGVTQIQAETDAELREFLGTHDVRFTLGTNIGRPECELPTAGFSWRPTRAPVTLELWTPLAADGAAAFSTVGRWDDRRPDMVVNGAAYSWRKRQEWLKFLALPALTGARFELAMDVDKVPGDRALLEDNGWAIVDPFAVSGNPDAYRQFIRASRGEFTVAKDLNVRLRSGWFSDRGACYLAAGRPVITQDTAFGDLVPGGGGALAFRSLEEAVGAVRRVERDYCAQSAAAHRLAREYFEAETVIRDMLTDLG